MRLLDLLRSQVNKRKLKLEPINKILISQEGYRQLISECNEYIIHSKITDNDSGHVSKIFGINVEIVNTDEYLYKIE